jgi:hypothetical protein
MEHDLEKVGKHHIYVSFVVFFPQKKQLVGLGTFRNDTTGRGTGPAIGCLRIFPVKVFDQKVSKRVQDGGLPSYVCWFINHSNPNFF